MSNYEIHESHGTVKHAGSAGAAAEKPGSHQQWFHPVTVGKGVMIRGFDSQGCGLPGAARIRHGVHTAGAHLGSLDICTHPNHHILSPIEGTLEVLHPHDPVTPGVAIRGTGEWEGYEVKIFHVRAFGPCQVKAGQPIGVAVDIRTAMPGILNHVHIQTTKHVQATNKDEQVNTMYMFGWFSGVSASSWTVRK